MNRLKNLLLVLACLFVVHPSAFGAENCTAALAKTLEFDFWTESLFQTHIFYSGYADLNEKGRHHIPRLNAISVNDKTYRIFGLVGAGGEGAVYWVKDEDKDLAVKYFFYKKDGKEKYRLSKETYLNLVKPNSVFQKAVLELEKEGLKIVFPSEYDDDNRSYLMQVFPALTVFRYSMYRSFPEVVVRFIPTANLDSIDQMLNRYKEKEPTWDRIIRDSKLPIDLIEFNVLPDPKTGNFLLIDLK